MRVKRRRRRRGDRSWSALTLLSPRLNLSSFLFRFSGFSLEHPQVVGIVGIVGTVGIVGIVRIPKRTKI